MVETAPRPCLVKDGMPFQMIFPTVDQRRVKYRTFSRLSTRPVRNGMTSRTMSIFAFRLEKSDPRSNWIEQLTNAAAQAMFLTALLLA